ncbi:MAG TPA: DsbA family protein [Solirubrobacteraceae bacterium]|nr:DsbA family protein [Solirubrobacteraceae bacterium]
MPSITITHFTDPGCPFAWSAEPSRRRLQWLYGDQLEWQLRMVGLAERGEEYLEKGFTPERMSESFAALAEAHGMPMDTSLRPRMAGTIPACRAVVAVRRHAPEREAAMLRALRILHFSGSLLDEPSTLAAAAQRADVDPGDLERWLAEPETEALLAEDLAQARRPTPAALALPHKLAATDDGGYRYTCPSYELRQNGHALSAPGFEPTLAYEVAIANLDPELTRREDPEDVTEVLRWAGEPLACAEVAAVCGISLDEAREQLQAVAAQEQIGQDGLWSAVPVHA